MFKAVIFDLDGVITDTAQFHFVAWKKLGEKLGIPLTESFNEELKGVDRTESLRRILALGSMENQFTDKEKEAFATEKNDFYVQLIEQLTPEDILPGISALLVELTEANIQIGLASASKNAPKILQNLNLMDTFDTIVNPELLTKGKPDPEIFIRAAEQLNVTPNQCIGIEDAYSGVQAINDAKMISIGVGDLETLKAATAVVPDTSYLSLEQLIQQWNK